LQDIIPYNSTVDLAEQTYNFVAKQEDVKDLYKIQNAANAARELAKQAREPKIHWNHFMALAIWARWKIGKMIPESGVGIGKDVTLKSLDIDGNESHRWQLLARIDKDILRRHITEYDARSGDGDAERILTFSGCYKLLPKPSAPEGSFDVIVIDPPWEMKKIARLDRPNQEDMDYAASWNPAEIIEWGATNLHPAVDCHLFLWTTQKYLPAAFHILNEWNVKYVCTFGWHKPGGFQPVGLPQYNLEFVLYGRLGSPAFIDTKGLMTCFSAPRGIHSEKPDAFYEMIAKATTGKRLTMFERKERQGFRVWGDEM